MVTPFTMAPLRDWFCFQTPGDSSYPQSQDRQPEAPAGVLSSTQQQGLGSSSLVTWPGQSCLCSQFQGIDALGWILWRRKVFPWSKNFGLCCPDILTGGTVSNPGAKKTSGAE